MRGPPRPTSAELRAGQEAGFGGPLPAAAAAPIAAGARPRLRLVDFTPRVQGALRGFATVELPIGLKLHNVPVFAGRNGPWAILPTRPLLDRDRRQRIGADDKPAFAHVAEWCRRSLADQFSAAVIELVRAQYPGALDDEGGP